MLQAEDLATAISHRIQWTRSDDPQLPGHLDNVRACQAQLGVPLEEDALVAAYRDSGARTRGRLERQAVSLDMQMRSCAGGLDACDQDLMNIEEGALEPSNLSSVLIRLENTRSDLDRLEQEGSLPKTILYNNNPMDNFTFATMIGNFQGGTPGKLQFGSGWWHADPV